MGHALNMKWTNGCGSPLTDDNLYYLACKAFRNNNLPRSVLRHSSYKLVIGDIYSQLRSTQARY